MAGNEESETKKPFQVVDKRRFDSVGNERTEETPAQAASASKAQEIANNFRMQEGTSVAPEVTFSSFVMSLATQAMVQLGQMASPAGMDIPVDIESGKGTIDILAMLQQKTRGNLSKEEGQLLEDILHALRMSYVRRAKPAS